MQSGLVQQSRTRYLFIAASTSLLLCVYVCLPNKQYAFDAIDFATAARDGVNLWHPHHLLYNGLGRLAHLAAPDFETIRLLAALNSVVTVLTALAILGLGFRVTNNLRISAIIAAGYSVTHGVWYMATSVECYPMASLCEVIALYLAFPSASLNLGRLLACSVASAFAVLFHQTGVFFVPAMALLLSLRNESKVSAAAYLVVTALLVAAAYVIVGHKLGLHSVADVKFWIFSYIHSPQFESGQWGGGARLIAPLLGGVGALTSVYRPYFTLQIQPFAPYVFHPADLLVAACAIASAIAGTLAFVKVRPAPRDHARRDIRLSLVLWVVLHSLFTIWWEAVNFEFWIMLLPAISLLIAMRMAEYKQLGLAEFAVACLAASTFLGSAWPAYYEPNAVEEILSTLRDKGIGAKDLVLTNIPDVAPYGRYFLNVPVQVATLCFERPASVAAKIMESSRTFLLDTERYEVHGLCTKQLLSDFYDEKGRAAQQVGTYHMFNREWPVLQLRK